MCGIVVCCSGISVHMEMSKRGGRVGDALIRESSDSRARAGGGTIKWTLSTAETEFIVDSSLAQYPTLHHRPIKAAAACSCRESCSAFSDFHSHRQTIILVLVAALHLPHLLGRLSFLARKSCLQSKRISPDQPPSQWPHPSTKRPLAQSPSALPRPNPSLPKHRRRQPRALSLVSSERKRRKNGQHPPMGP